MFPTHKYPYTNFQDLNLDWFLTEFNTLEMEWDSVKTEFSTIQNFFDNLDVQDEINNKLQELYESGELATLLNSKSVVKYGTAVEMSNDVLLPAGSICVTSGRTAVADGGAGLYYTTDAQNTQADGGRVIACQNGVFAVSILPVNPDMFPGNTDSEKVQAAFDAMQTGGCLLLPRLYNIGDNIITLKHPGNIGEKNRVYVIGCGETGGFEYNEGNFIGVTNGGGYVFNGVFFIGTYPDNMNPMIEGDCPLACAPFLADEKLVRMIFNNCKILNTKNFTFTPSTSFLSVWHFNECYAQTLESFVRVEGDVYDLNLDGCVINTVDYAVFFKDDSAVKCSKMSVTNCTIEQIHQSCIKLPPSCREGTIERNYFEACVSCIDASACTINGLYNTVIQNNYFACVSNVTTTAFILMPTTMYASTAIKNGDIIPLTIKNNDMDANANTYPFFAWPNGVPANGSMYVRLESNVVLSTEWDAIQKYFHKYDWVSFIVYKNDIEVSAGEYTTMMTHAEFMEKVGYEPSEWFVSVRTAQVPVIAGRRNDTLDFYIYHQIATVGPQNFSIVITYRN